MEEAIEPSVQETESTGLLDGSMPETEEVSQDTNAVEIDHRDPAELQAKQDYENADDEPLERPDWWPENFWKGEEAEPDLEAIAKSWTDLRKQISQGKHKAPADGKYDTSAFGNTPEDDPVRKHVMDWARDNSVSQSALDHLVGKVVDMGAMQQETFQVNVQQEMKQLGPNADARINGMKKWGASLVSKGIWSNDDYEEFTIMGGTARGINALEKLRSSYEGSVPIEAAPVEGAPSKDELYQMVGDEKYKNDPAYRAKVEKLFAQNFGS